MTVNIHGVSFDTKRVMRFAPHRMGGLDFRPEDVTTLEELERLKAEFDKLPDSDFTWTIDRMGWRFLFLRDKFGNTFPQCFAPISGNLEMPERSEENGES